MVQTEKIYERDNRTGLNHEGPEANRPVKRLTAMSIIGDKVENFGGENLGHIKDLMIDIQKGVVEYAVLEYGAVFGIGGKLFAIPFSELNVHPAKKLFIIEQGKEFFQESPGFDKGHWPDTNLHKPFKDLDSFYNAQLMQPM